MMPLSNNERAYPRLTRNDSGNPCPHRRALLNAAAYGMGAERLWQLLTTPGTPRAEDR